MNTSVQQTQIVLGQTLVLAALGTLILSLASRWIGGVWTTLLAITAACLLAYKPLLGTSVFGDFKTDLLRRILIAAIPFTVCAIALSFKRVPIWIRIIFTIAGPSLLLYWIFSKWNVSVPRLTLLIHNIFPVAIAVLIGWMLIEPIAVRTPGPAAPMVLGFFIGGVAFLLMLSSENQAGLISPVIPATAGGAMLAAVVNSFIGKKPLSFARGPVLLWLTLIAAVFAFMWFDTDELPAKYLLIISSALLLAWIPEIGLIHRMEPWKRESLRFVLLAVPVVIAVVLAFKQHKREAAESGDEYGLIWPQSAAPIRPSQTPIASTIIPPTIT